jgi:hypothetical protein
MDAASNGSTPLHSRGVPLHRLLTDAVARVNVDDGIVYDEFAAVAAAEEHLRAAFAALSDGVGGEDAASVANEVGDASHVDIEIGGNDERRALTSDDAATKEASKVSANSMSPTVTCLAATFVQSICDYARKFTGDTGKTMPARASLTELAFCFVGVFLAHALLILVGRAIDGADDSVADGASNRLVVGSFGALAVLCYAAPHAAFSQPWLVIGGHVSASFVAVACRQLLFDHVSELVLLSLGMACAITAQHALGLTHPPAGGAALIVLLQPKGSPLDELGFWYVLYPCATGTIVFVAVALLVNNLSQKRFYPQWWRGGWGLKFLLKKAD